VEELARLGADLSMRNQHCLTALDIAVRKTNASFAPFLYISI
jgi:hypothetical protein